MLVHSSNFTARLDFPLFTVEYEQLRLPLPK